MKQEIRQNLFRVLALGVVALLMTGCAGMTTGPEAVRAGDTVALYAGWKHHFDPSKLTITFTGSDGSKTVYQPGDSRVRAVIDKYPDPLSYLAVGTHTGLGSSEYHYGSTYGALINSQLTGDDPDWWETLIYVDTPTTLPTGTAQVQVSAADGETYGPVPVNIIPGTGSPAQFGAQTNGPLNAEQLASLSRMPHYTVNFSGGSTIPSALEVWLTHDPDETAGGPPSKAYAVNPVGETKNLSWSDDGTHMRVLLLPSGDGTWQDPGFPTTYGMKYWKFYVTGGLTNVQVTNVVAYDKNGNVISGVTATLSQ
jgi:hypothetical protein